MDIELLKLKNKLEDLLACEQNRIRKFQHIVYFEIRDTKTEEESLDLIKLAWSLKREAKSYSDKIKSVKEKISEYEAHNS